MRFPFFLMLTIFFPFFLFCQETQEQIDKMESLAEAGGEPEEEDLPALAVTFGKKLDLNKLTDAELTGLAILNAFQVAEFFIYRKLLGPFIDIHELQAIPGWDSDLIKMILPYVRIADFPFSSLRQFHEKQQFFRLRISATPQCSKGFKDGKYIGSREKLTAGYRYTSENFRVALMADKDPGESFLRRKRIPGFDFYSGHVFIKKAGRIQALAIGDYTINIGQGLIHWQSLAFKKSSSVMNIKRQSAVIKPYTGTGEYNFLRGVAIAFENGPLTLTMFSSFRKLSAHLEEDTLKHSRFITSFNTSGGNRTEKELRERNNASDFCNGILASWQQGRWKVSLNTIFHRFPQPLRKTMAPYNLFALSGKGFFNSSVNYDYTSGNLHSFGEVAVDGHQHIALIQGLMLAADRILDISCLYRRISRKYQSIAGNAFTENTMPNNEEGCYVAFSLRPIPGFTIDGYADVFSFPWLKYQVNAPSGGKDNLLSLTYRPNKQIACYLRYKHQRKTAAGPPGSLRIDPLIQEVKEDLRLHTEVQLNRKVSFHCRFELTRFKKEEAEVKEGVMTYVDLMFKPPMRNWSARGRIQFFQTDDYDSRIYAYQSSNPGAFSIPAFYGTGKNYALTVNYQIPVAKNSNWKWLSSFAWTGVFYNDRNLIGTGEEEITGNHRSVISVQLAVSKE